MKNETPKPDLGALQRELDEALVQHKEAEKAESYARNQTSEATNRLNRAQKALDAAIAAMRSEAPWNTDWRRSDRQRDAVAIVE